MAIQFSNLASSLLASGVSSTATSISVNSAASFPTLESGDYFYATIGLGSGSEIVKVTEISGTTFTVLRGQDDTTAVSHSAGVDVALRVNAGALLDLRNAGQTYTAGSGLSVSDNEFTNTAPDQTVALTGAGATAVSGTYPNFTITSTDTNTVYTHPSAHAISFITGLQTALDGKVDDSQVLTDVPANALFTDTVYTLPAGYATETYVSTAISNLVDSSPATLDTLNELAAALGDDPDFATTVSTSIGTKWTQDNTKISNWDAAYGWGDHASAGYLTSYTDTNTTYSIQDGELSQNNFTDADHTKLNGIAESANNYTHPSAHAISFITGLQAALDGKVDDSQVLTDVPENAVFTDTNTTYSVGDGGLTEKDFTAALKTKLDGIAASANNYSHPSAHTISFITGLQTALDGKVDDSQVLTDVPANAVFTDNNTTYSVGDGGLTEKNFTATLKTKLDGVEASADVTDTGKVVAALTAGTNVAIAADGTISSTDTNTTYSVEDGGLTQKNFTTTLKTKLDGIEASADVTDTANVVAALTAGTNVAIAADGTISSTDTNTTYSVGDGGLTQKNFTTTLKTKLDGIAASANNYSLPFTDNSANWNTAYGWGDHGTQSYATESYVGTQISNLVDSSPSTLNTLNELAAALGDDANFSTTVTNSIATKLPLAGGTLTGNLVAPSFSGAVYGSASGAPDSTIWGISRDSYPTYGIFYDEGNPDKILYKWAGTTKFNINLETGALDTPSTISASGGNSTNWNTAYGWGDHASEGYYSSANPPPTYSKYLRSDTSDTMSGTLSLEGNLLLTGSATTSNQSRTIDFTGFDKEGTTDTTDRAYITHTTNTGGHSGSALVISSQNDANDGIAFATNSSSQLKHNGKNIGTQSVVTTAPTSASGFPNGHVWYVVG